MSDGNNLEPHRFVISRKVFEIQDIEAPVSRRHFVFLSHILAFIVILLMLVRTETDGHLSSALKHYENAPMQYTEIFKVVKIENFQ